MIPTPTQVYEALRYRIETGKNGSRQYYNTDGQLHRMGGPAVEWAGCRRWYQHDQLHRTDGPAVEYDDGTKWWCQNGQRHRTDGPAIEHADGSKAWFINNEELSEDEFNQEVNNV